MLPKLSSGPYTAANLAARTQPQLNIDENRNTRIIGFVKMSENEQHMQ